MVNFWFVSLLALIGGATANSVTVKLFTGNVCTQGGTPPSFETVTISTLGKCQNSTQPFGSFILTAITPALECTGVNFVASSLPAPAGASCNVAQLNAAASVPLTASSIGACNHASGPEGLAQSLELLHTGQPCSS